MTGSHETFPERLDRLFGEKPSIDANDLAMVESQASSLISEISHGCAEFQSIACDAGRNSEKDKLIETLVQKISTRRHNLGSIKDTLIKYMHAAESNAQKLESQYLNEPDSELNLQRAAETAWKEVQRLSRLLEQISQALSMSDSASKAVARKQSPIEEAGDFRFTATSRDPLSMDGLTPKEHLEIPMEKSLPRPLLGHASPGDLADSLKKVPIAAQATSKIQAGLYKGGIYIESANINTLQMDVSAQGVPSSRSGERNESSLSQKGGDGSYMAGGDMGVFSPTQKNDFGIW